jgi:formylglycine-generating enzyme required for sulfatase activity
MTQLSLEYFSQTPIDQIAEFESDRSRVRPNGLVLVKGGSVVAGKPLLSTEYYGWDNEFGKETETVLADFEVSSMLVSNAEYATFIEAGGYTSREYWSEKGWEWAANKSRPMLWADDLTAEGGGEPQYRSLSKMINMPYDWPVAVVNFEAEAFCQWKSAQLGKSVRLISHTEWLLLAKRSSDNCNADYNNNFRHYFSPCAVDKFGSSVGSAVGSDSEAGVVYDVCGNLWQHSRSALSVLEEFAVHPVYDDFTLPTIDGDHRFLLGGSFLSIGDCASLDGRYGFRRHFFQFAGIRYVVSDNEDKEEAPTKVYEGQ